MESRNVKVLVVGGNEIQSRDAVRVQRKVEQDDSGIEVEFLHSGWDSNWNKHFESVKRKLAAECHAVVILRFMRTQLGRKVRAECSRRQIPWRSCWSGGQDGIARAVGSAAGAGRQAAHG